VQKAAKAAAVAATAKPSQTEPNPTPVFENANIENLLNANTGRRVFMAQP